MINVTIGESKTQESKPFPKLMIGSQTHLVVLFVSEQVGVVITTGVSPYKVGEFSHNWYNPDFTDYNEPITLQNA
jgi:hypothetical protein